MIGPEDVYRPRQSGSMRRVGLAVSSSRGETGSIAIEGTFGRIAAIAQMDFPDRRLLAAFPRESVGVAPRIWRVMFGSGLPTSLMRHH